MSKSIRTKKGKNTLVGKVIFIGFEFFFLGLSLLTYFIAFQSSQIKEDDWYEVQVTYVKSNVKEIHHGMAGKRKSIYLFTKEFQKPIILDSNLFKNFSHNDFVKTIRPNEKFHITIPKLYQNHNSKILLAGLRKNEKIYFSISHLKELEKRVK